MIRCQVLPLQAFLFFQGWSSGGIVVDCKLVWLLFTLSVDVEVGVQEEVAVDRGMLIGLRELLVGLWLFCSDLVSVVGVELGDWHFREHSAIFMLFVW